MVAPPLGNPISLVKILRFAKSAQFTAAPAEDHAAAIRIPATLLTSAVFNLNIDISTLRRGLGTSGTVRELATKLLHRGISLVLATPV
jgi:hypothetical protein